MTLTVTTWQTDDLCPACGNALTATDDGQPRIILDCPACGWTAPGPATTKAR